MILPHVLLVTPDALLASSLGHALREWYRVTPLLFTALVFQRDVASHLCDLILLDLRHLPPPGVPTVVEQIGHSKLVLLAPPGLRTAALPGSVLGALSHRSEFVEIRMSLDHVHGGQRYYSPHLAAEDRLRYWKSATPPTARQREVFELKQRGLKNGEIATELGVVRKAVEAIVTELRQGFGLESGELFDWRDGRL